ncbi:MAG: stalk domain-containing protein [Defluviitaleaceae bacterium]|nr:stalk domain-containing protein [Defluviitaleaceae bacterium]
MKKLCALILTVALLMGIATPVFAYNNNGNNGENGYYNNGENGYENSEHTYPALWEAFERPFGDYHALRMFGFIGEKRQADCGNYTVEILDAEGEVQLILWLLPNMRAGFAVIDAVTGFPAELSDHADGEVLVFYGPVYTTHEIPQSNALSIIVNIDNVEYNILPSHHTIESIRWNDTEDAIIMAVDNGGLYVTIYEGADLQAWLTRQIVTLSEFQIGDEVLLWYGMVATSYPAQTTATRALRLVPVRQEPSDIGETHEDYNEGTGYGEAPYLVGHIEVAGVDLYRVNLNAENRGFEVMWNAELRRAELTRGDTVVTLAPGFAVFYINGEAHTMSAPSLLTGGRLFAPADFFDNL